MAASHVVSALANKRAEIAGMIPQPSSSSANFALIWFILTLPFVYLLPQWSQRRPHRRGSVNRISGSNQEVCHAVCSMRFVGRVRRSAHQTSSGP
jgi:hypothetical protein